VSRGTRARTRSSWPTTGGVDPPRAAARRAAGRALAEDLGPDGDVSAALVPATATASVRVVSRAEGVLAGRLCAAEVFARVDPDLAVTWHLGDGDALVPGSVVAEVSGPARSVLTAERSALTRRYVDAVAAANPATRILDTRKTTPGLRALEKAAVRAGGGWNHRFGLSDVVLVKDNHLGYTDVAAAVGAARERWPGRVVEVECDVADHVRAALDAGADAVLLDNMTPPEVARCVALVRAAAPDVERPDGSDSAPGTGTVLVEVSGGVTLHSAPDYAAAGADLISVGALTHSAPALDLGLDLAKD